MASNPPGSRDSRTLPQAVECQFCGKVTRYKAVPGSEEEHRAWIDCIRALQGRLDGSLSGLATAASKERESRTLEVKNPS